MRRSGLHLAPGVALHVASVFGKADGKAASGALLVTALQLLQGFKLRVHQRVHGIHDERGDAVTGSGLAKKRINDGQEIREALARTRAAGGDVTFPPSSTFQRLGLVLIKVERLAAVVAENLGRLE